MLLPSGSKYFSLILCLSLTACASLDEEINKDVTANGTVPLDKVRIGSPEMLLKEAKITFVQDDSAQANAGGKRQYLSREKTPAGGQYIVQCIDNNVFEIDVDYKPGSITRQAAEDLAGKLLPADAPIKLGVETIHIDNQATARLNYADSPAASPVPGGVTGGGGNLAVKLKDPKARKAFADRHNCEQKNDKTKPGYWSCRLPRYAKSLGLSGGGTWW